MRDNWRFIVTRMNGDGTEVLVEPELPLSGSKVEIGLCATSSITGQVAPETRWLRSSDGAPILLPMGSALYAEYNGTYIINRIVAGGIVTKATSKDHQLAVQADGWTSYLKRLAWTAAPVRLYEKDPAEVIRTLWNHVQTQPRGNIGLDVDVITTDRTVGTYARTGSVIGGGVIETQDEPFVLAKYATSDLSTAFDQLVETGGIDYAESHMWGPEFASIYHRLRMGYPRLGKRLEMSLEIGVDVVLVPDVDLDADDHATEVLVYGAGEGPTMAMGHAINTQEDRLRTVRSVVRKDITNWITANSAATQMARLLTGHPDDITQLVVDEQLGLIIDLGDEFRVFGDTGWGGHVDQWVRLLGVSFTPDGPPLATLEVERVDKVSP